MQFLAGDSGDDGESLIHDMCTSRINLPGVEHAGWSFARVGGANPRLGAAGSGRQCRTDCALKVERQIVVHRPYLVAERSISAA